MNPQLFDLVARVRHHVVEVGDCWEWIGAYQRTGCSPAMRWDNKVGSVRRFIAEAKGVVLVNRRATYSCGNFRCVNPEHVICRAPSAIVRRRLPAAEVSARLVVAMAARRKLTDDQVLEIRASDERASVLARRYGVTASHINNVRVGRVRTLMAANPFAGLMR